MNFRLDLHGYTVHDAWRQFKAHTEICELNGIRKFTVITGRGKIYDELPKWAEAIPSISEVLVPMRGPGSYQIVLKKKKIDPKISIQSKNPIKSMVNIAPLLKKWGLKG